MPDEERTVEDRLGMLKVNVDLDRKNTQAAFAGLGAALERLEAGQARLLSALTAPVGRTQAMAGGVRDETPAGLAVAIRREQASADEVEALRMRVRTLNHSQATLADQCSALSQKLHRVEDRLAALEGRGA